MLSKEVSYLITGVIRDAIGQLLSQLSIVTAC